MGLHLTEASFREFWYGRLRSYLFFLLHVKEPLPGYLSLLLAHVGLGRMHLSDVTWGFFRTGMTAKPSHEIIGHAFQQAVVVVNQSVVFIPGICYGLLHATRFDKHTPLL